MLIRNNRHAPVDIYVPSLAPGHCKERLEPRSIVAYPDELDDAIRSVSGNIDLFNAGWIEEITSRHRTVKLSESARRPRMRLEAPIVDAEWLEGRYAPSMREIVIERGEQVALHPDFLAFRDLSRFFESGVLEVV